MVMQSSTMYIKVRPEIAKGLKALSLKRETSVGKLVRQAVLSCYQLDLLNLNDHQKRALEALEKAAAYQGSVDILFTDAVMPIMGGRELSEKIHDIYPDISVLFASGYMDNGIHQEILALGKDRFIHKPYSIKDVIVKIRQLLDVKRS